MVISESLISIVFRTVNTLMVVVCAVYVFNKYALIKIKRAMDKKEQELIDLRLQGTKLGLEIKKIELQIKKEEGHAVRMQEKIQVWSKVVDAMRKLDVDKQESLLSKMTARQEIKKASIQSAYIQNRVVPRAINQAREVLKKHFESPQAAQQYITDIVVFMRESEQ